MHIPQLAHYFLIFKQRVEWGDMDAYKHVNNVQYYRYCENARVAYFNRLQLQSEDILMVVRSSSCRYFIPIIYLDTIHIGVRVEEVRTSAFRMTYTFYSEQHKDIVAQAESVIVCINTQNFKKIDIPSHYRDKIIKFENNFNHNTLSSNKSVS